MSDTVSFKVPTFITNLLFIGVIVAVPFFIIAAFGLILSKGTQNPPPLNQRAIKPAPNSKPIVPVVQPKSLAPKITKVDVPVKVEEAPKQAPVLEPKSIVPTPPAPVEIASVVEEKSEKSEEPEVVVVKSSNTIDDTFEAYRQAMLASGPRQMEEEARAELQSKNGAANSSVWREQTASLRQSLKDETAAAFLERTNTSINDRMVAIFDAVKA